MASGGAAALRPAAVPAEGAGPKEAKGVFLWRGSGLCLGLAHKILGKEGAGGGVVEKKPLRGPPARRGGNDNGPSASQR